MERFLYSWKRRFCATLEPILLSVSVAVARFGFDGWIELAGGMGGDVQWRECDGSRCRMDCVEEFGDSERY